MKKWRNEKPPSAERTAKSNAGVLRNASNPNNGNFYVKLYKNDNDKQVIDLYSTNGKLVNSYLLSGNVTKINNSGLSEGIYFLNSRNRGINSTTKIIIKN